MSEEYSKHYSVMNKDVLEHIKDVFNKESKLLFADMTFGAGGHTLKLAQEFPSSTIFSVDQDPEAYQNGQELINSKKLQDRIALIHTNFENFTGLDEVKDKKFNAIVMDLGVSSHHFDDQKRGFSFRFDANLDMRMNIDDNNALTAADILNSYSEEDIANIIYEYGEERYSRRIAKRIVEKRNTTPIQTTKELEEICFLSYPQKDRHKKIHPATKTFQALRIFVNRELEVLENTLEKLFNMLDENGLLLVISFHSLEDRIVKHKYKEIFQLDRNTVKIVTKKPQLPSDAEVSENPRSRSAKLRVIQRVNQEGYFGKKKKKRE
jgi:16S rRNA (cytosine1402-N4)-methyltransferase